MVKRFKVGDHVTWNSEAGHVSGRMQKSEQIGTRFRSKAAGDFGGKRHLISLQSGT
jgi:hypothetical protein